MIRNLSLVLLSFFGRSFQSGLSHDDDPLLCGFDPVGNEVSKARGGVWSKPDDYWKNAAITWSYAAADPDPIAVHIDNKTGLSSEDIDVVKKAIAQIEEKTCLKFTAKKPEKSEHWIFVSREGGSNGLCYQEYIANSLSNDINGYGDLYSAIRDDYREYGSTCFRGGWAYYGSALGQLLVISSTRLSKLSQGSIGLVAHEILHNLGIAHTQKRPDSEDYINIAYDNIRNDSVSNYRPSSRIRTFNTSYDCMSIMHYRDTFFLTKEAKSKGAKSMYAKDPSTCDLSSSNNDLLVADYELINKMYCSDGPKNNIIISPNYPAQYPNDTDKEYLLSVDNGSSIELDFTDFKLENQSSCSFDWVLVEDRDGTELLPKSCGDKIPNIVTSNTNQIILKFHSDRSVTDSGFRAVYRSVSASTLSGSFKSRNYPSDYPKNEDETYQLVVPSGSLIEVNFDDFYLESHSACNYDYVKIVESDGSESDLLCDDQTGYSHRSTGNKLDIIFHSDDSVQRRGFSATWREIKP